MSHPAEVLRKRLEDAGTRELVKLGDESELEREMLYGRCPVCWSVRNTRFRIRLDENNHLHASLDSICNCVDSQ